MGLQFYLLCLCMTSYEVFGTISNDRKFENDDGQLSGRYQQVAEPWLKRIVWQFDKMIIQDPSFFEKLPKKTFGDGVSQTQTNIIDQSLSKTFNKQNNTAISQQQTRKREQQYPYKYHEIDPVNGESKDRQTSLEINDGTPMQNKTPLQENLAKTPLEENHSKLIDDDDDKHAIWDDDKVELPSNELDDLEILQHVLQNHAGMSDGVLPPYTETKEKQIPKDTLNSEAILINRDHNPFYLNPVNTQQNSSTNELHSTEMQNKENTLKLNDQKSPFYRKNMKAIHRRNIQGFTSHNTVVNPQNQINKDNRKVTRRSLPFPYTNLFNTKTHVETDKVPSKLFWQSEKNNKTEIKRGGKLVSGNEAEEILNSLSIQQETLPHRAHERTGSEINDLMQFIRRDIFIAEKNSHVASKEGSRNRKLSTTDTAINYSTHNRKRRNVQEEDANEVTVAINNNMTPTQETVAVKDDQGQHNPNYDLSLYVISCCVVLIMVFVFLIFCSRMVNVEGDTINCFMTDHVKNVKI